MDEHDSLTAPGRARVGGRCTGTGTIRFADRCAQAAPGYFREGIGGLTLSSIGMGTYLGEPDDATDLRYETSLKLALSLGCNVIDTAGILR